MFFYRFVMFFNLFICGILCFFEWLDWRFFSDSDVAAWLFIFAAPTSILILPVMIFVFIRDLVVGVKKAAYVYYLWSIVDLVIPILSLSILDKYYRLLVHL